MNVRPRHEDDLKALRAVWQHHGDRRPAFADTPGPGQESVWDYPRPPVAVSDSRTIEVWAGDTRVAVTRRAVRVLETASPPCFYLPREDVDMALLRSAPGQSHCEWKGAARYFDVVTPEHLARHAAWSYERPFAEFADIAGHIAFYANRLACFVDGERVRPQPGHYYGGWVTDEIVGPFKGGPRSAGW